MTSVGHDELTRWLAARGHARFRSDQVWGWLLRGVGFEAMDGVPKTLRDELAAAFRMSSLTLEKEVVADQGLTTKMLYGLDGGYSVEAVVMRYPSRITLCISSQVGCPIGCPFCATGQGPFGRNLRSHEIVEQALDADRRLAAEGRRLSHVVFMGMGEPLNNYQAVVDSVRQMADPDLLGISPRRMVISTSGLVPGIGRLLGEGLSATLAISLHAARNDLRDVLVPVNRKYPLEELIPAAREFAVVTGRRVSYEWVLLAGVNDTDRDADELLELIDTHQSHINVIPFNPVDGSPYRAPSRKRVMEFAARVRKGGLNVTVRDTRGRDGDAACGQLRARSLATVPLEVTL
ncbi:MAG TPA: 23S rRNA (adenine(2503)-C(2))-methyltransferase RlmN [Candidatus Dormibacteraeota bacterium]|nr:23S rRNA (adenine(2503)-C(2))-methyltransferase RlmN [Candidatus Dormibacteraeota bacterium]